MNILKYIMGTNSKLLHIIFEKKIPCIIISVERCTKTLSFNTQIPTHNCKTGKSPKTKSQLSC